MKYYHVIILEVATSKVVYDIVIQHTPEQHKKYMETTRSALKQKYGLTMLAFSRWASEYEEVKRVTGN